MGKMLREYRFFILLAALAILLFAAPIFRESIRTEESPVSSVILTLSFVATLLSSVFTIGRTSRTNRIAVYLGLLVILFVAAQFVVQSKGVVVLGYLLSALFLGYVLLVIIRHLFNVDRVSPDTICGSLCAYVMLALLWALVMASIEILRPGSFLAGGHSREFAPWSGEHLGTALYFSFVTLTTLGFGDVVPVSPATKMLVALEALVGQLFLTVLVARLVGLQIAHASSQPPSEPPSESR